MNKLILLLALTVATTANAEGFRPYLGAYTGFNSVTAKSPETDKSGLNLGVKGVGSYEFDSMFLDAGLGWQYNKMSSSQVEITTKSVFTEVDARFKLGDFSIGPIASLHFGIDNTQAESITGNTTMVMGGVKAVYQNEFSNKLPWRVELNVQNSLSGVGSRNNLVANVGFQIALPWSNPKPAPVYVAKAPVKVAPVAPKEEVADVKVTLKSARVGFETDVYKLDSETKRKLALLGKYLGRHPELFGRIKISGHTDTTGSKEYNLALSQDRADSVMKVLVENGVPEKAIQARGFGFSRPIDERNVPDAWEKNRRTEIEFFEVTNRAKLNEALEQILK